MEIPRTLSLSSYSSSILLLGPRMTGKTTLLSGLDSELSIDLLDPLRELELRRDPSIFWEEVNATPEGSLVIVDEIQKVPVLLDYVQMAIDRRKNRFVLSGSSARKLKRGGANLLGGRAIEMKLHSLSFFELGEVFDIMAALSYGTLPRIHLLHEAGKIEELRKVLRSYYSIYIKEEIQAEAITRKLGDFQRFLDVAAQMHSEEIQYSNIATAAQVPSSTVKEYFSILEDTLIGSRIWQWGKSEKDKFKPKFYFFDCGVVRAIRNRLVDPPTPQELGKLFESWMYNELLKIRDYNDKPDTFSYWKKGKYEIDFVIERERKAVLAIEVKSSKLRLDKNTFHEFRKQFPDTPIIVATLEERSDREVEEGFRIASFSEVLKFYQEF